MPNPTAGSQTQASQDRARHHRPILQDICGHAKQVHVSSRRYSSFSPLASGSLHAKIASRSRQPDGAARIKRLLDWLELVTKRIEEVEEARDPVHELT
ncbi:MAG: hypothetical protein M3178_16200 [Pseudomonadota bacterium]|nr:hypothetical protein [Pseudomonadota bacterium]